MTQPVYVVDAFTSVPFGGNPAAVVPLTRPASEEWMQHVAAEMNLSETAFIDVSGDEQPRWLRWFTPTAEVDLCGHATLATAHVLGGNQRFLTRSGVLDCTTAEDGWISMDFPADPPRVVPTDAELAAVLPQVSIETVAVGVSDLMVVVQTAEQVRATTPDLAALARMPYRGLIVTAQAGADDEADFVSRCFYPAVGVPEDPVTGSAHCTLGSWWAGQLGRTSLVGRQASRRGGLVRLTVGHDRVVLAGQAVTVMQGTLLARG